MNKIKAVTLITILTTIAMALTSLLLPVAPDWQNGWALYHIRIIIALCIPALHVIAALFFLLGLQGFKEDLRRAYTLVATSIVISGVCLLASPIVTLFDLWDSWLMLYGIPNLPFLISVFIMGVALSVFFKSLNVASIWRKWWFTPLVAVGFVGLVVVSPHKTSHLSELTYDIGNALFALTSILLFTLGAKLLVVRRRLTTTYGKTLTWLAVGLLAQSLLVGSSIIVKAIGLDPRSLANLQDVLLVTVLPFIRSGYLFYQLTADTRVVDAKPNASAVEVVTYVASLASNVQDIDPILDGVRNVTSHWQPGTQLSEKDQQLLGRVYLQLETHLEHKETYRTFTKKQLRDLVYQKFNSPDSPSSDKLFWQQLPQIGELPLRPSD